MPLVASLEAVGSRAAPSFSARDSAVISGADPSCAPLPGPASAASPPAAPPGATASSAAPPFNYASSMYCSLKNEMIEPSEVGDKRQEGKYCNSKLVHNWHDTVPYSSRSFLRICREQ